MEVTYMEALLMEQIIQGKAEVMLNRTPGNFYVNDRMADESIVPYLQRLYDLGLLDVENPFDDVTYYTVNEKGKEALHQTLALSQKPC